MKAPLCTLSAMLLVLTHVLGAGATEPATKPTTRNVAIVLYEGVELLDFAGPGEVFAAAANFGAVGSVEAFKVYTVATTKAPLTSQGFVRVLPDFDIDDAPRPDIIVVPGGPSSTLSGDDRFMAWARKAFHNAEVSMSVCTGAFVLGKAGLLDGHTATTWYGAIEGLRKALPRTTVEDGRRFVDEGRVVTTAGVSAGIDGALHVVARLLGREVADKTARYMEYRWTPEPYLAEKYAAKGPPAGASRSAQ